MQVENVNWKIRSWISVLTQIPLWIEPKRGSLVFFKVNIHKNTEGTFEKFVELIESTKDMFVKQNIDFRLWNRYFNTINDYKNNATYGKILKNILVLKQKQI
jgi:hypothetical protein